MVVSGWVHRQQLIVIEYLQAENRSLKERLRGKRIRFTDAERALLGLVTHYLLFVMSVADRVVEVLGVTAKPDDAWMLQLGRNLIDWERGGLREKRYLIIDWDSKNTEQFRRLLCESGTRSYGFHRCRRN